METDKLIQYSKLEMSEKSCIYTAKKFENIIMVHFSDENASINIFRDKHNECNDMIDKDWAQGLFSERYREISEKSNKEEFEKAYVEAHSIIHSEFLSFKEQNREEFIRNIQISNDQLGF